MAEGWVSPDDELTAELLGMAIGLNTRLVEMQDFHKRYKGNGVYEQVPTGGAYFALRVELEYADGTVRLVVREVYPGRMSDGRRKRRWLKRRTAHWKTMFHDGLLT